MKEVAKNMRLIFTSLCIGVCLLSSCRTEKLPVTTVSEEARKEFINGRDLYEKLQFSEAKIHLEKAIELDSSFVMAYLFLSTLQQNPSIRHDYINKAKSALNHVSDGERLAILVVEAEMNGDSKHQEKYLQDIVELYPRDERALTNLGTYYFARQNYEKALVFYKRAIEVNPEYPSVYNQIGYTYRFKENYPDAEKSLKKYIALIPDNPNPYDSYAELLLKMGEFDVSMETYQKALEMDPNFAYSHFGLASNLIYMREYNKARQQLKRMIKIATSDDQIIRGHYGIAITFLAEAELENGLKEIDILTELSEKNSNIVGVIRNYYLKTLVLYVFDELDRAQKVLDQGREIMVEANLPPDIKKNLERTSLFYAALIAVDKKNLEQASAYADKFAVLAEDSDDMMRMKAIRSLRGYIAFGIKDFSTAVTEFEQSNLEDPVNLYWLASSQMEIGQNNKAVENFEKVIQYNGLATVIYVVIRNRAEKILARLRSG